MDSSNLQRSLTPELIRQLLDSNARAELSADYVRLMEIYCVVKAGGTAAQIEAARRLEQAEQAALKAEIQALTEQPDQAGRIAALKQEIREVERSVANRLAFLHSIEASEEANVRSCIPVIDAYFAGLSKHHG